MCRPRHGERRELVYSDRYFLTRESWRDWRIEARELVRLAHVERGTRVLEIGCGGGGVLRLLLARGAMAVGVDKLHGALALARTRLFDSERPVSLVQVGEKGGLAFRSNSFDAIIGQHLLEHVGDMDAALCEWKRVLKPAGRLAIATPNARYPDRAHFADADHVHIFSMEELGAAMERAGLTVESGYTLFPYLSHLRALRVFGVLAHRLFQHAPYWSARGRTIMLVARKASE